jgi:hypothetical protein
VAAISYVLLFRVNYGGWKEDMMRSCGNGRAELKEKDKQTVFESEKEI